MSAFRYMRHAHGHDLMGRRFRDVLSLKFNFAPDRRDQARHGMEGGRLAGAVGTDQGNDLALVYFK